MTPIERLSVEVLPNRSAKAEEDVVQLIGVGGVQDVNNPPTIVLELVAYNRSPDVCLFHHVGLAVLDVSGPRVQKSAVRSGHPAFTREWV